MVWKLVLILVLSFLIRIIRVDYPLSNGFAWGDGTRDFLVSSHIVKYGEFPLVGPHNLLTDSGIKNSSPIYFYLLALFLTVYNNILTLSVVNILLQVVLIARIFFTVKILFNQKTAFISILLYSFNWEVLHQSDYIWQPNLMLPLMGLSCYLLVLSFLKKDYPKLLWSIFLLVLAFAIHNSAFPWVPAFLFLIVLVINKWKFSFKEKIGIFSVFIFSSIIFYLPVLKYSLNNLSFQPGNNKLALANFGEYFANFYSNITQIFSALNLNNPITLSLPGILTIIYFLKAKDNKKKLMLMLIILAILPIIFASFFDKIRLHYLILSMPALIIFISRLIVVSKNGVAVYVLTLTFFTIISGWFKFLSPYPLFTNQKMIASVSETIKVELTNIQKNKGYKDFSFFQIRSYALSQTLFDYPLLDSVFIIPLEEILNQKLSSVSNESYFNHIQTGKTDYILVVCHQFTSKFSTNDCLNGFLFHNPRYAILKNLYMGYPISIYIAKHE